MSPVICRQFSSVLRGHRKHNSYQQHEFCHLAEQLALMFRECGHVVKSPQNIRCLVSALLCPIPSTCEHGVQGQADAEEA
jgi:hypothetical protein